MARPYTNFGRVVSERLATSGLTQQAFSSKISKSVGYFNQTLTGTRRPNPDYVDLVARGLDLSDNERQKLHYLAAIENGFKLDLTKK